jgi:hypothetical protein
MESPASTTRTVAALTRCACTHTQHHGSAPTAGNRCVKTRARQQGARCLSAAPGREPRDGSDLRPSQVACELVHEQLRQQRVGALRPQAQPRHEGNVARTARPCTPQRGMSGQGRPRRRQQGARQANMGDETRSQATGDRGRQPQRTIPSTCPVLPCWQTQRGGTKKSFPSAFAPPSLVHAFVTAYLEGPLPPVAAAGAAPGAAGPPLQTRRPPAPPPTRQPPPLRNHPPGTQCQQDRVKRGCRAQAELAATQEHATAAAGRAQGVRHHSGRG